MAAWNFFLLLLAQNVKLLIVYNAKAQKKSQRNHNKQIYTLLLTWVFFSRWDAPLMLHRNWLSSFYTPLYVHLTVAGISNLQAINSGVKSL